MSQLSVTELKSVFTTGAIPTANDFGNLFESFLNFTDSQIEVLENSISGTISDRIFIINDGLVNYKYINSGAIISNCIFINRNPNTRKARLQIGGNITLTNCIFINCFIYNVSASSINGTATFYNCNFYNRCEKCQLNGGFNFYKSTITFRESIKVSLSQDCVWKNNDITLSYDYDSTLPTLFYTQANVIFENNTFETTKNSIINLFSFSQLTANKSYFKLINNNFGSVAKTLFIDLTNSKYYNHIALIGNYIKWGDITSLQIMPRALNNDISDNIIDADYTNIGTHGSIYLGYYISNLSAISKVTNNLIKVLNPNSATYKVTITLAGTCVIGNIVRCQSNVTMTTTNAYFGTAMGANYNKLLTNL